MHLAGRFVPTAGAAAPFVKQLAKEILFVFAGQASLDEPMPPELQPQKQFASPAAWRRWLEKHHTDSSGLWLKLARQSSDTKSVTYAEALEVALCFGWIDGQKKAGDETFWLQKFGPRKSDSLWSQINRQKALVLIERGLMQPAGQAAIARARENGRWESAYEAPSRSTIPADLQAALDQSPSAATFFKTLTSQNRYAILFRLQTAKKPETRAARLVKFIGMLERGETLH